MFTPEVILLGKALIELITPIVALFCYWFALKLKKRYRAN